MKKLLAGQSDHENEHELARRVCVCVCACAYVCYARVRASLVQVNESVRSNYLFKLNDSLFSDSSSSHHSKVKKHSENVQLRNCCHQLYSCTQKQTLYIFIYNYVIIFALRC